MTEQTTEEFWTGNFGDEYTARNRVDWRARIPFWREVLDLTGARSVYEFGCNAGWNLSAIKRAYPDVAVYGEDVNQAALRQAKLAGLQVYLTNHSLLGKSFLVTRAGYRPETVAPAFYDAPVASLIGSHDLAFTCGVLIHVQPEELEAFMKKVIRASAEYVLAVEYDAYCETEVEYRGHSGKLWKRPFGKLYQDMGLKLVMEAKAGPGFDDCTAWLLKK